MIAHKLRHPVTQAQVSGHPLGAQVQIAVFQPQLFVNTDSILLDLKRQLGTGIEHLDGGSSNFDRTGSKLRIDKALTALTHDAFDLDNILDAKPRCLQVTGDYYLQQTGMVT